jgi:hypothetical protein
MDIEKYLSKKGPCLASQVKEQLLKEGQSETAARKVISRLNGNIYHLDSVKLPKRESFLYLKSQYKSTEFYTSLYKAFQKTSSIHGCLISALIAFGGSIETEKFRIISGSPQKNTNKKIVKNLLKELGSIDFIIKDGNSITLTENFLYEEKTISDPSICIFLNELYRQLFANWLRKNSFVSYGKIKLNGEFCSYYWDITAPSYILPLIKRAPDSVKPGFVVVDFIPQYEINTNEVEYYIRKMQSCSSNKNNRPFIPFLIGNSFTNDALTLLRSKNVLVSTLSNFFGKEIDVLLNQIITILKSSTKISNNNSIENIEVVLNELKKIEGETNNLRGHFFEMIVGNFISEISPGIILLSKKIKCDDGNKAEIDVLNITTDEIFVYECKSYNKKSLISETDIDEWFSKISKIYTWIKESADNASKKVTFNYWTTSSFHDDAMKYIVKKQNEVNKYNIKTMNCKEIYEYSKKKHLHHITELIRVHFL